VSKFDVPSFCFPRGQGESHVVNEERGLSIMPYHLQGRGKRRKRPCVRRIANRGKEIVTVYTGGKTCGFWTGKRERGRREVLLWTLKRGDWEITTSANNEGGREEPVLFWFSCKGKRKRGVRGKERGLVRGRLPSKGKGPPGTNLTKAQRGGKLRPLSQEKGRGERLPILKSSRKREVLNSLIL